MPLSILENNINNTVTAPDIKQMLENGMTNYWQDRSESYSDQNMAQLFSDKKAAWESLIFGQVTENRRLDILDIGTGPGFFAILSALRGHNVT